MATEPSDRMLDRVPDPDHQLPAGKDGPGEEYGKTSVVALVRQLADDMRTLVQQEIRLAKMEALTTAKRVAIDSAWIGAGVAIVAVGGLCLIFALALGLGALLDSYWLGTLITAGILLLIGGLFAWKGIHDLSKGGFAPRDTMESLDEDKTWAQNEADDLKKALKGERT